MTPEMNTSSMNSPWGNRGIYMIAEIGINHNGSVEIAKELINNSKEAGFDAVKFQKREISIVYSDEELNKPRESPWGTTQREQKMGLEFSLKQYEELDSFCKTIGIDWFVSCWDEVSQVKMKVFKTRYNKVASAMATNIEFLKLVSSERKPTFLSTGMCTYSEIDRAIDIFKANDCPITLMHTVSDYPCVEEDLNLRCINTLAERYKCPVGYSGHETGVSPSIFAAMLGATCIERHVTIDRSMYGSDQSASLEMAGMRQLVSTIRKIPHCLGDGVKRITEKELVTASKLRYWAMQ